MKDQHGRGFLSARIRNRLMGVPESVDDARPDLIKAAACARRLLAALPPADRDRAERVLAEEMEELLMLFCLELNTSRRQPHVHDTLRNRGLVAAVDAACDSVAEVFNLFSAAGA